MGGLPVPLLLQLVSGVSQLLFIHPEGQGDHELPLSFFAFAGQEVLGIICPVKRFQWRFDEVFFRPFSGILPNGLDDALNSRDGMPVRGGLSMSLDHQ